jgi:hypothetical protein
MRFQRPRCNSIIAPSIDWIGQKVAAKRHYALAVCRRQPAGWQPARGRGVSVRRWANRTGIRKFQEKTFAKVPSRPIFR